MTRVGSTQVTLTITIATKVSDNPGCCQLVSGNEGAPGIPELRCLETTGFDWPALGVDGQRNIRHMTGGESRSGQGEH